MKTQYTYQDGEYYLTEIGSNSVRNIKLETGDVLKMLETHDRMMPKLDKLCKARALTPLCRWETREYDEYDKRTPIYEGPKDNYGFIFIDNDDVPEKQGLHVRDFIALAANTITEISQIIDMEE